jgi:hypothetical protein
MDAATSTAPPPRIVRGTPNAQTSPLIARPVLRERPAPAVPSSPASANAAEDDFNPVFLTFRAFGISTLAVSAAAVATVLGVKYGMGVENVSVSMHLSREISVN